MGAGTVFVDVVLESCEAEALVLETFEPERIVYPHVGLETAVGICQQSARLLKRVPQVSSQAVRR